MRRLARRFGRMASLALACIGMCAGAPPAQETHEIHPYLEVDQIASTDLSGGDSDVLTYTQAVAGVDASIQTRRVQVQISYQYQRRVSEGHHDGGLDESSHDGLVRADVDLGHGLSLEAGGIATRVRSDIRQRPSNLDVANDPNEFQAYAAYAGPTLATHVGDLAINASYRLAYVKVDDDGEVTVPGGGVVLDRYSHSWNQAAGVSVGTRPGTMLPFGWTVSGGWTRETSPNLSQRATDRFVRVDVIQPISATLAITGGVGDQDTRISQRAPVIGADGFPVIDKHGRYVADRTRPRLVAYDVSGLIYEGGVTWRPSPRTSVEAHVGHQYGSTFYTGAASWQFSRDAGFQAGVFNDVESFGRLLTTDIAALPTGFQVHRTGLGTAFGGCVFGATPGAGGCLNDALQSANTSNFRNRGAYALVSGDRGPWSYGLSASYVRRDYLGVDDATVFTLDKLTDQSWNLQADIHREVSRRASLELDTYADWYKTELAGSGTTRLIGADASLYYSFGNHIGGTVGLGLQDSNGAGYDSDLTGSLLVGLRVQF